MSNPSSFEAIANNLPQLIPASGSTPGLTCQVNCGGGGFEPSIIFILNQAIRATIYQNSWNKQINIRGNRLGPYCLHVTANLAGRAAYRCFRQYNQEQGCWEFVPGVGDNDNPYPGQVAGAVELMMSALNNYLLSHNELVTPLATSRTS